MFGMSYLCFCSFFSFRDIHAGCFKVSHTKTMNSMFYDAKSFNQDISSWDVSNVNNMELMFYDAESFDQDLSSWKVPKIPSKPTSFNALTPDNFRYNTERQPQWGVS